MHTYSLHASFFLAVCHIRVNSRIISRQYQINPLRCHDTLKYFLRHKLVIRSFWPRATWRHFPALNSNLSGIIIADWESFVQQTGPHMQTKKFINYQTVTKNFYFIGTLNMFCWCEWGLSYHQSQRTPTMTSTQVAEASANVDHRQSFSGLYLPGLFNNYSMSARWIWDGK